HHQIFSKISGMVVELLFISLAAQKAFKDMRISLMGSKVGILSKESYYRY
ncbi:Hypothetical protein FKW44_002942, partial [Caligus rogercresseyi]